MFLGIDPLPSRSFEPSDPNRLRLELCSHQEDTHAIKEQTRGTMDRGVNDAICSSLFLASETKQTAKRICAPPFATLTSALSAPATAGTSAILLLLLSPGVVRALRGRRPLQTAAVAVSAGRRRRRSSAGAACGIARLRRGRGPHRPDGRSRELGASGCGAREHGARG